MKLEDINELHYITPVDNVASILQHGILCHDRVKLVEHTSIAMTEIQERRNIRRVPGARALHKYVNLYFDAHNPMLSKRRDQNDFICVLRVSSDVLGLPGVIVADRNASSDYVNFHSANEGIAFLERDRVFARYWTHPEDLFDEMRHKSEKCAEVLVPQEVSPHMITGAYVANQTALAQWARLGVNLIAEVKSGFFF